LGKFDKSLKGLRYEDLFHLYLYITIGNETWRIEKNEVVSLAKDKKYMGEDCLDINLSGIKTKRVAVKIGKITTYFNKKTFVPQRKITLGKFIQNGVRFQKNFWSYNAKGNNCQNFCESLLLGNKLIKKGDKVHKFIKQDSEAIFKKNPKYLAKFGKTMTDIAGVFDVLKEGR